MSLHILAALTMKWGGGGARTWAFLDPVHGLKVSTVNLGSITVLLLGI